MDFRHFAGVREGATYLILSALVFSLLLSPAFAVDDPWADSVVSYHAIDAQSGFTDPSKTLGAPAGGGTLAPNNGKAYCIGSPGDAPGSYVTLKFNSPVLNDPANPMGIELVVHGNAFWVGGVPTRRWSEAALVEVSADVNGNGLADDPWYVIPGSRGLTAAVLPAGIANPSPPLAGDVLNTNTDGTEQDWGYSDMSPSIQEYRDNYLRPDDPRKTGVSPYSGGGDAFDISWAVKGDGTPANLAQIDFVRVSAFINGSVSGFGTIAPEVSAAVDIDPLTDSDGDGVTDSYETRVAGTDPARPESTVLPLEIPPEYGGSPLGAPLGTASDTARNAIALYSSGARTGARLFNCNVDIEPVSPPGVSVPGRILSGALRDFAVNLPDFATAQVQDAELTLAYSSSQIAGLDEAALEPWRFDGTQWTQEGVSALQRDPANNRVVFRSTVPGLFALASVAGSGDQNVTAIPVVLHATPAQGVVANGADTVSFVSDTVMDGGVPVADGTFLTITVTPFSLASITTADAEPGTEGVQVAISGGRVSFALLASTIAGRATVRAASADGLIAGDTPYAFVAGPPAQPTDLWLQNPSATAPGPIYFYTGAIRDAFGNVVPDGTQVTVDIAGAVPVGTADADPAAPGYQAVTFSGIANFAVRTDTGHGGDTKGVQVQVYAEPGLETLLAEGTYAFPYVPVPGPSGWIAAAALLLVALQRLWRRKPAPGAAQ